MGALLGLAGPILNAVAGGLGAGGKGQAAGIVGTIAQALGGLGGGKGGPAAAGGGIFKMVMDMLGGVLGGGGGKGGGIGLPTQLGL